jgi:acetoin:2,6-dichlorophenolindophenol oxidoreductase subunit beta
MCINTFMTRELTYAQAISEALVQGMEADPAIFLMGLGVDDHKGIFGTTREAFLRFGKKRVFDTPASEGALTGIAIGAALNRKRPVLIHARNDFMFLALDQMINNAAKWKYTYAGRSSAPFVVRGIIGKGWGQGPTHSQSIQSLLTHFPGLIIAMPSQPHDIKGIFLESFRTDTPVVVLEHRALYDLKGHVPQEPYRVPFGKARVVKEGSDLTVVAFSFMVPEALKAAEVLAQDGISVEVVDPVTLQPLDEGTIIHSVNKTGRLIAVDTSWERCGIASEIAAVVAERAFQALKAPVRRVTLPPCPSPVSKSLEEAFYPTDQDIVRVAYELLGLKGPSSFDKPERKETFFGPY